MKKLIVISGYLAGGKSTLAVMLSDKLQIPCFIKDTFKIALCKNVELTSRAEKSRFSVVTFDAMLYAAEQLMKPGYPLILEGNFLPAGIKKTDEAGELKVLIQKYGYEVLHYRFYGDTKVLHQRFLEREETEERGEVNKLESAISQEEFAVLCHNMDAFDVGCKSIDIDTTDFSRVDYEAYMHMAEEFLK